MDELQGYSDDDIDYMKELFGELPEVVEEFYWLDENELKVIKQNLTKLPYEMNNWIGSLPITLYSNADDNLVVVMDCDGEYQVLYGASSKESYDKLMEVMDGLGEAI